MRNIVRKAVVTVVLTAGLGLAATTTAQADDVVPPQDGTSTPDFNWGWE